MAGWFRCAVAEALRPATAATIRYRAGRNVIPVEEPVGFRPNSIDILTRERGDKGMALLRKHLLLPDEADEARCWERLADFLGYQMVSTGRRDGSSVWLATMLRPDGSFAQLEIEERDLRNLIAIVTKHLGGSNQKGGGRSNG